MFSLFTFKPDRWYIIATCHRCKVTWPLFEDLNQGKGSLSGNYGLTCPACGYEDIYQPEHYLHTVPSDPIVSGRALKSTL